MIALFEEVPFTSPVFGSGKLNSLFSCVQTGISYFLVNVIAALDTKKGKKLKYPALFSVVVTDLVVHWTSRQIVS